MCFGDKAGRIDVNPGTQQHPFLSSLRLLRSFVLSLSSPLHPSRFYRSSFSTLCLPFSSQFLPSSSPLHLILAYRISLVTLRPCALSADRSILSHSRRHGRVPCHAPAAVSGGAAGARSSWLPAVLCAFVLIAMLFARRVQGGWTDSHGHRMGCAPTTCSTGWGL
eukprot:3397780-Rhodomonas_salina.1